ncbi:alpha-(1-_3)-arabinofuranosyltransferase family protein [Nocardioides sp. SR21]|uniref:alpha-(1->3)-arabinofuranosyltransferase domain-containing protein n=1 Tax=Nocardioides sp. SR21 TaxID=2919501 RepID=UPI001FAAA79D|nr:alpha-(1->3)-arabinofuranosyltransferase family protein [Nocardioides sp. SR21]
MADSAPVDDRHAPAPHVGAQGLVSLVVTVGVLALNLIQQPGLVTFDTKLDLQFDVTGFLTRSLDVWTGDWTLGGLQNQAYGYLVPMGPAFWLGDLLHLPMWIWERLWTAAVMLLAYFGMLRLARSWPGIGATGAVLAGLTYMLAPRVLTTVGGLSGETLPSAILPWTVLPVVLYLRGRLRWWVAILWSSATIPWMGGQNATLVVACLMLPGLLMLLTDGRSWPRRIGDAAAWTGAALLASLWWLVPLLLMGEYAPPFLSFIESAADTASQTGWLASFRGTSHWVAFFPGGGSAGWVGGWELVSSAVLLATTVAVAGIGLLGLMEPGLWARRVLVTSMLVGLAFLTVGSPEPAGSVFGREWLDALDSWLAPLRNVHKFDPLIRLPLALGLGAFVTTAVPRLVARSRRLSAPRRRTAAVALTAAVVVLVGAAAQPAASGDLRVADGAVRISTSWQDAAEYLREQEGPVGVLVLPGTIFSVQTWGRTIDEPIQVLNAPPWASRSQSAVAPAGTLRLLDAIENQIADGHPISGFASSLRRMGITHVVARNDLDPAQTDAPPVPVVMASLGSTTGLTSAAVFGSTSDGYPAVAVFEVQPDGDDPRVALDDWDSRRIVQGGPEAVNDLAQVGLVSAEEPVLLADAAGGAAEGEPVDVVTDSNQRVERSFGRITDAVSGVMTRDEPYRLGRREHDFTGGSVPEATTVADYGRITAITASSSGGYADVLGPIRSGEHPYAAFDASGFTAWTTAPLADPVGQWIEVEFAAPARLGPVTLLFDNGAGADVSLVRLSTDAGSVTAEVGADGIADGIELPDGLTSTLRITVEDIRGDRRQVRLANVSIGGVEVRRSLRVPGEVSADTSIFFRSEPSRRACVVVDIRVTCGGGWQQETPETPGFDRTVTVTEAGLWELSGRAVATGGAAIERLFAPLGRRAVEVEVSSTYAGDPAVVGVNAYDGLDDTSWYASPLDPTPGIQLSWRQPRTIRSVLARLGADQPGVLPESLTVDPMIPGSTPQVVSTTGERAGFMKPVRTTRLRITAVADPLRSVGVGIGELEILGLDDLRQTANPTAATGVVCGFGPTVEVGGRTVQTRIVGDLSEVVDGSELTIVPCGDEPVRMGAGTQRIRVTSAAGFAVSRLWLTPASPSPEPAADASDVRVVRWTPTARTIAVRTSGESILTVSQSENPGWEARLDGRPLDTVVVDGWKQAWRVPAGSVGEVELVFVPQSSFQNGIVIGLVLAGLLNVAALVTLVWFRRRPPRLRAAAPRAPASPGPVLMAVAVAAGCGLLALASFPLAVGALAGVAARRRSLAEVGAACASLLAVAVTVSIGDVSTVITPPSAADVLTAGVVGIVAGRVLFGRERVEETA